MGNENNIVSTEINVDVIDKNDKKEIDNQEFTDSIEKPKKTQPIKKKKAKIVLCVIFICVLIVGLLFTYFKLNENVFKVEKMIDNIGEITLDSEKVIQEAEDSFNTLSDSEKKRVKNKDVLEKSKEQYSNLLIESFENSSLYNKMEIILNSGMALYNPKMTFNKSEKTLTITLSVDSDIEELIIYYPSLAKPTWNRVVKSLNVLGKTCYDLVESYGIDVVLEMYPESSSYLMLFKSLNGETKFDVLD